jgi:hypothetical protein
MENEYAAPEVIEVGNVEEMILGEKCVSVETCQPGIIIDTGLYE